MSILIRANIMKKKSQILIDHELRMIKLLEFIEDKVTFLNSPSLFNREQSSAWVIGWNDCLEKLKESIK